jgi:RHS repeat-associated protein
MPATKASALRPSPRPRRPAIESLEARVLLAQSPAVLTDFAAFGQYQLSLAGRSMVQHGLVGSNGDVSIAKGSMTQGIQGGGDLELAATVSGDVVFNRDVLIDARSVVNGDLDSGQGTALRRRAVVNGSVTAGADVTLGRAARVTGGIIRFGDPEEFVPIAIPPATAITSDPARDISIVRNRTQTLAPGKYGDLFVGAGGTVKLSAGEYSFDRVTTARRAVLNLDVSAGEVAMLVVGNVSIGKSARVVLSGGAADRSYLESHGTIFLGGGTQWFGTLFATNDLIVVGPQSTVAGAVYSNIRVSIGASVELDLVAAGRWVLGDTTPPTIQAFLANDTGSSETDSLTFDATIAGRITDNGSVVGFRAGFDDAPLASFLDVSADLQPDGAFSFDRARLETINGESLADGPHTLHLEARDSVGNTSSVFDVPFTLDTHVSIPHSLRVTAATDTGTSDSDGVTKLSDIEITGIADPGVLVRVINEAPVWGQSDSFADGTWTAFLAAVEEGPHLIAANAEDIAGNVSEFSAPIIVEIDFTPPDVPQFDLDSAFDTPPVGDHSTANDRVTLIGQGTPDSEVTLPYTGARVVVDASGSFLFTDVPLNLGTNALSVIAADVAGNTSMANQLITLESDSDITVSESLVRVDRASIPLHFGDHTGTRTIEFDVNATFDRSNRGSSVPDTFSVYLVDASAPAETLVDRADVAGTALFSLDEHGQSTAPPAMGVTVVGNRVSIDASRFHNVQEALLVFEMFDGDLDTGSQAIVSNLTFVDDPTGTPPNPATHRIGIHLPGPAIALSDLTHTPDVAVLFDNLRFSEQDNLVSFDLRVRNNTGATLGRDMAVLLRFLVPEVQLLDPAGKDAFGFPYVNLRNVIPAEGLPIGAESERLTVQARIQNPQVVGFFPVFQVWARTAALEIFEQVANANGFQAYRGVMKGFDGVADTQRGNAWDLAGVLVRELRAAGMTAFHVYGRVQMPVDRVLNWLGAQSVAGAQLILDRARLSPTTIMGSGSQSGEVVAFEFDHAWARAHVQLPGQVVRAVELDPSFEQRVYQPGIPNIVNLVPFDQAGYLSRTREELTHEFYSNAVQDYLNTNLPGTTLSDVPYIGTVIVPQLDALPELPFTVVGLGQVHAEWPVDQVHRVRIEVRNGSGGTLAARDLSLPTDSHKRISITWRPVGLSNEVIPLIRLDGDNAMGGGTPVARNTPVQVFVKRISPAGNFVAAESTIQITAGQIQGLAIDANQIGPGLIAEYYDAINSAGLDYINGDPVDEEQQIGALMGLAAAQYFLDTRETESQLLDLLHAQPYFNGLEVAYASAWGPTVYELSNPIIAAPRDFTIGVVANRHSIAIDGDIPSNRPRNVVLGFHLADQERAVWETILGVPSISTPLSLQLASDQGTPIVTFDSTNAEQVLPTLDLASSVKQAMQSYVAQGFTITTPSANTPVNRWDGVGFYLDLPQGDAADPQSARFGMILAGSLGSANGGQPTDGLVPNEEECECEYPRGGPGPTGRSRRPPSDPAYAMRGWWPGNPWSTPAPSTGTGFTVEIPQGGVGPFGGQASSPQPSYQAIRINDGNLILETIDIDLPNIGEPLWFVRRYDSSRLDDVGFGIGWMHNYSHRLLFEPDDSVTWITETGRPFNFQRGDAGNFITPEVLTGTLTQQGGTYRYVDTDGTRFDFDLSGHLLLMFNRHQFGVELTYDANGLLTSIHSNADPARRLDLLRGADGEISQVLDHTGRTWSYTYLDGRLSAATLEGDASTPAETTTYDYYTDQALSGLLSRVTEPTGDQEHYSYYPNRMLHTHTDPHGAVGTYQYSLGQRVTTYTNERGVTTRYEYDDTGLIRKISQAEASGQVYSEHYDWHRERIQRATDRLGRVTTFEFDNDLNITRRTDPDGRHFDFEYNSPFQDVTGVTDPLGQVTALHYDTAGNLIREIDALGNETTHRYDARGLRVATTAPQGNLTPAADDYTTSFVYNSAGQVTARASDLPSADFQEYDARGNLVRYTDANGQAYRYTYDLRGRLLSSIDPLGRSRVFAYDKLGRLVREKDELGRTTSYDYDEGNSAISIIQSDSTQQTLYVDRLENPIRLVDELGNITRYQYDPSDRLIEIILADGSTLRGQYDAVGNLVHLLDANGHSTTVRYDVLDRLTQQVNALGDTTQFEYDVMGNLTRAIDPLGHVTTTVYDELDRPIRTTDALGHVWTVSYDANGNIQFSRDPDGHTTSFAYDVANRLVTVTDALGHAMRAAYDPVGNTLATTDRNGRVTRREYDALNRPVAVIDPLGERAEYVYDVVGNLVVWRDRLDRETKYKYDQRDRLVSTTNSLGDVVAYGYDASGNLRSATDELGRVTRYAYDALYRPVTVVDALGGSMQFAYDLQGNLVEHTDELDRVTRYEYDAVNRVLGRTDPHGGSVQYEYDPAGRLLRFTDELDRATQFAYDDLNRLSQTTDALGGVMSYVYDSRGNVSQTIDELGRVTSYGYDEINRLTTLTDAASGEYHYSYDAVGNLLSQRDPLNRVTTYDYDALDRTIGITSALGGVVQMTFDAEGNVLTQSDQLGYTTSYEYDALNRPVMVTDAIGGVIELTYDKVSNLLSLTDPEANTTAFEYDALNRLTSETNALGGLRLYQYDAAGNLTGVTDRNGRQRRYRYDLLDRTTAEEWLDGGGLPIRTFTYVYDAASQLLSAADPASSYACSYDADGRVTSLTNSGTPGVPEVVFSYSYDAAHNLLSRSETIAGAASSTNAYTHDALDRVTQITQSGPGVAPKRVDFTYDAASQMTGVLRFADLTATQLVAQTGYTFDLDGRLTELTHSDSPPSAGEPATNLAAYGLTYDAAHRITQIVSRDGPSVFSYDTRNQLTSADHASQGDELYTYDGNGNRTTAGYVTGPDNRLLSDGTFNYTYDGEGNRVTRTNIATGEVTQYDWDYRNRLIHVTKRDSGATLLSESSYVYDVFDLRIGKSVDADGSGAQAADVTRFVLDGVDVALQFDGAGSLTHRYLHGPAIDQVLADENALGQVLWPLTDHLGTVRDVADSTGAIVNHIRYDSFGRKIDESNPAIDHLFGYTGRELDEETGLNYYRARYYDSVVGQFISEDPMSFAAGDANLRRYVDNNPLSFLDPSGLVKKKNCLKGRIANQNSFERFSQYLRERGVLDRDLDDTQPTYPSPSSSTPGDQGSSGGSGSSPGEGDGLGGGGLGGGGLGGSGFPGDETMAAGGGIGDLESAFGPTLGGSVPISAYPTDPSAKKGGGGSGGDETRLDPDATVPAMNIDGQDRVAPFGPAPFVRPFFDPNATESDNPLVRWTRRGLFVAARLASIESIYAAASSSPGSFGSGFANLGSRIRSAFGGTPRQPGWTGIANPPRGSTPKIDMGDVGRPPLANPQRPARRTVARPVTLGPPLANPVQRTITPPTPPAAEPVLDRPVIIHASPEQVARHAFARLGWAPPK